MKRLRFDSSFWVGVSPSDGGGRLVVMTDVAQEFDPQIVQRAKDAACDHVTLDLGEPIFDLVEPGGVGRREVHANVGMNLQEGIHQLGFVRREVVGNHVDDLARRLGGDDVLQEADELRAGMAPGGLAQDRSALSLQGGIKRERPVAKVFKPVRLGAPRRRSGRGRPQVKCQDSFAASSTNARVVGETRRAEG